MVTYKKENGFPLDLVLNTKKYSEILEDDETWTGWETEVLNEDNKVIVSFTHKDYRDRIHWVNGFFSGLKYKN